MFVFVVRFIILISNMHITAHIIKLCTRLNNCANDHRITDSESRQKEKGGDTKRPKIK